MILLILAFPIWFYAEMQQADKVLQQNRQKNLDSTTVMKNENVAKEAETSEDKTATVPVSKHLIVSN